MTNTQMTNTLQELQDYMFDTMCSNEMAVDWYCDRFNCSATDEVIDFVLDATMLSSVTDSMNKMSTKGNYSFYKVEIDLHESPAILSSSLGKNVSVKHPRGWIGNTIE